MKAVTTLFVAAIALNACATTPLAGSSVRGDGLARIDQPTRVGALVVTPMAVVEDSRCPINARCVWPGDCCSRRESQARDGAKRSR